MPTFLTKSDETILKSIKIDQEILMRKKIVVRLHLLSRGNLTFLPLKAKRGTAGRARIFLKKDLERENVKQQIISER